MDTDFLTSSGWAMIHSFTTAPRRKKLLDPRRLSLSKASMRYLSHCYPEGIYRHQKQAIEDFAEGKNICITTGTASGKSMVFYVAAIEQLEAKPQSRIIAIYPLKALGREQEGRWTAAFARAGISTAVGRIDGQVSMSSRSSILRECRVVIMTPDVIHAWFLSNLSDKSVLNFIGNLSLIVCDEIHNYTGVFGSNAAFLFRRIQHILGLLGISPRYICASATISKPTDHLRKLFGQEFAQTGPELDTSPRHGLEISLVSPPKSTDLLTEVSNLLHQLAGEDSCRFIAFVDSRKQTEQISSILARSQDSDDDKTPELRLEHLDRLNVLPYRAGYEEHDRDIIQNRLSKGSLHGVVSTSALELGIDIPSLDTAVLIGVPRSSTSLHQRIGRIGRHSNGRVIVVNTGTVFDEAVFRDPEKLLERPLAEGALYLGNSRIQYIHALCLSRHGGEHDQVCSSFNISGDAEFSSPISWPEGFLELCRSERLGEIPQDLQSMKAEAGEDPNHTFPLRDVESQFKVELKQGPEIRSLGSLSYGQLMREAYPGAVYYYTTEPFRVSRVNARSKSVQVRREKRYTTKPQALPTMVYPNLSQGNIYHNSKYGDLCAIECNLQIREALCGFKERRGSNESSYTYPLDSAQSGVYFSMPLFTRYYFTTGVIITHPILSAVGVNCELMAGLLYEAFSLLIPFERRDINFGMDRHRTQRGPIHQGEKFLAIYDQTYGSLRLSGHILEDGILRRTFHETWQLLQAQKITDINSETMAAFKTLYGCSIKEPTPLLLETDSIICPPHGKTIRVIMPGSKGLNVKHNNEEFIVEHVFYHPSINGLAYRGRHLSTTDQSVKEVIPIANLIEVTGESQIGVYDFETGETKLGKA